MEKNCPFQLAVTTMLTMLEAHIQPIKTLADNGEYPENGQVQQESPIDTQKWESPIRNHQYWEKGNIGTKPRINAVKMTKELQ